MAMNIMNATKNFLEFQKLFSDLGKSQVSKSFQGHSYWLLIMNLKTENMYMLLKRKNQNFS